LRPFRYSIFNSYVWIHHIHSSMQKFLLSAFLFFIFLDTPWAQDLSGAEQFWKTLAQHCGKAYEGEMMTPSENDPFTGKKLVMHIRECKDQTMRIPFFVGEDKSRTWVLTMEQGLIQLKHDHRHEDGSEDTVTQYGGISPNSGMAHIQFFPADPATAALIPLASTNVWWITVDETSFTYNLRRIGTDRFISVKFDLTKEVENPGAPWGS
jgi:hypothetical protein